ncbi:MAG: GTP cyclohydrolase, FolE2/MptA family [Desulfurococcaceae archaeon]
MNIDIPDVHDEEPFVKIDIDRVGLRNYKTIVKICRSDCREYVANLVVYINLPSDRRGVHLSRLVDSVRKASSKTHSSLIDYTRDIVENCLENNPYSSIVEAIARINTIYNDNELIIETSVLKKKNGVRRESLTIYYRGVISCPCAQRVYSILENTVLEKTPTHIQRVWLKNTITSSNIDIDPFEIYRIGISVLSGRLINYLNRYGEYSLLKNIISKPLFAEDVLRFLTRELYVNLRDRLSRDTELVLEIISEETLHEFDLHAVLKTSIVDLEKCFRNI